MYVPAACWNQAQAAGPVQVLLQNALPRRVKGRPLYNNNAAPTPTHTTCTALARTVRCVYKYTE